MVKKYLIRIIGSLCILGSAALMFLPGWLRVDDVKRRDLRDLRSDVKGVCSLTEERFVAQLEDEDFKDELKDYDLPYTRPKIKSRFGEISALSEELLNESVSLKELLILSVKMPGITKDVNNLLDSDCSDVLYETSAQYFLYFGSQATGDKYAQKDISYVANQVEDNIQDVTDVLSDNTYVFVLLAIVLILIAVLAVASAATHICNKFRWIKYAFLFTLVVLVVGTCVALSFAGDTISESVRNVPALVDMSLVITFTPFLAVALAIVPVVLDIIFERKKKQ